MSIVLRKVTNIHININLHKAKSLLYFIYLNTTNGNPSFLYIAVALGSPNTLANIKL